MLKYENYVKMKEYDLKNVGKTRYFFLMEDLAANAGEMGYKRISKVYEGISIRAKPALPYRELLGWMDGLRPEKPYA